MDSERFDGLARAFSQARSRRQALGGLAGVAAATALALRGREVSADRCKRNGKACKKGSQCCSDNCVGASGETTKDGTCQAYFQGTCQGGEGDFCFTRSGNCNPDTSGPQCVCFPTTAGGASVCVTVNSFTCLILDCTSNDGCRTLGDGYVCIGAGIDRGTCGCPNGTKNQNFCARQCNIPPASAA